MIDRKHMGKANENILTASGVEGPSLWSLFVTFLKIGSTAFGGFMSLISVVQNYAVDRRKLLAQEDMLDGISLATTLPGPVAVNVVAYVGYRVRGVKGALACAAGVILPAFALMTVLSAAYFKYGHIPAAGRLFHGFLPAVAAVIIAAAWNMGKKTVKGPADGLIAAAAFAFLLVSGGFYTSVAIIAAAGAAGRLLYYRPAAALPAAAPAKSTGPTALGAAFGAVPLLGLKLPVTLQLLFTFGGMSLLLFGGGYVFIPLMQETVVSTHGWVTSKEFFDGIALGQIMPGPIVISAAFIGYKAAGVAGAAAAALGFFGPPAALMILATRALDWIKRSAAVASGLRGVRYGVIGMIAAAAVIVAKSAGLTAVSGLIFAAALTAIQKFKVETAWVIPAAGLAGLLLY